MKFSPKKRLFNRPTIHRRGILYLFNQFKTFHSIHEFYIYRFLRHPLMSNQGKIAKNSDIFAVGYFFTDIRSSFLLEQKTKLFSQGFGPFHDFLTSFSFLSFNQNQFVFISSNSPKSNLLFIYCQKLSIRSAELINNSIYKARC